ncbi:MAG: hydrogenase 4 subunit B [Anaerolineae bacterium]|nr:hydrogenase 4 subunit B [Anaerolineae bacterium]MDL1927062.1 hydrogenase 4 subunit B [Anaerolineae bacterium AMX1]
MTSIQFFVLALTLYLVGALASLFASPRTSRGVAAFFGLIGSLSALLAVVFALTEGTPPSLTLFAIQPFGEFTFQMDLLSTLMVALIALVGAATSLYSFSDAPANVSVSFFTDLFMASMLVVVTVTNAFYFLVFWEVMTLASYFLVVWEFDKKESARTGFIYFLVAHIGAALIMVTFFLFFGKAGTFDFAGIRAASIPSAVKDIVFVLAFLGFGAKAGMVPLHFWTPDTYAAAPSHVSALMASVMKKTAVYGILRVCVDLLGGSALWWGFTVLTFGALSTVFGAFYALSEKDIKRLLALSSVENVGIILMGVGLGMIGLALSFPTLAALGFLAALYHMLNHAFFKGLLFLGAGSVIDKTGTRDLNLMGGLSRRMPWTALTFLVGALAVTAIPPLNGFVSEWFTYQALLNAAGSDLFALRVFAPLFAVSLALAGAFAVMVYVKAYGGAFAGPARSEKARFAKDPSAASVVSLVYLALGTIVLGLGAPWIAPRIAAVAADFAKQPLIAVSAGWTMLPGSPLVSVVSTPLVAILLIGLLIVPVVVVAAYGGWRASRRSNVEPWSNGYGYAAVMSVRASSFDQPVKVSFRPLYWVRTLVERPYRAAANFYNAAVESVRRAEPVVENAVTRPTLKLVETAGQWIQTLQMGDIRLYCLYIIITLAILLVVLFGGSGS